MTEKPTPIDPARVLAALEVLGWPDDRGEQYTEDAAVMPAEAHYRLAEDVIRAADAAVTRDRHHHIYGNRLTRGWGIGWGRLHGALARTGFSADRHLVVIEVRGRYLEFVR